MTAITLFAALALTPAVFADEKDGKDAAKREAELKLSAADGLPKPDALYDRFIKAMGGEEAIRKQTSRMERGSWRMPAMGIEGTFRIYAAAPSNYLLVLSAPGIGEIRSGYDGEVGWMSGDVTGTMLMEEQQLEDLKIDADFYYPVTYRKHYSKLKTKEVAEFDGKECYHVRGQRRTGDDISIFFEKESGLLIGTKGVRTSEHGAMNMTVTFSDFKVHDGVKVPMLMKMHMPDMNIEQLFRAEEYSHDEVDLAVFELPESIKRLVQRRKEAAERQAEEALDGATNDDAEP